MLGPVLQVLADGEEHRVKEIRDRFQAEFKANQQERSQKKKNKTGTSVFVNRVAGNLARLHMETGPMGHPKAIIPVDAKKKIYKITEFGAELLKRNPSYLTVRGFMGIRSQPCVWQLDHPELRVELNDNLHRRGRERRPTADCHFPRDSAKPFRRAQLEEECAIFTFDIF